MGLTRLNKIIADAGIASRRAADQLILDGRVSVDGQIIIELGGKYDPEISDIKVNGESLKINKSKTYLAFHKPAGIISTMSDPEGRPNLGDYFADRKDRLYHVGRLDKDSEGLILLTNDGDLAHRATHPSYGLEKKYLVEIEGELTSNFQISFCKGSDLRMVLPERSKSSMPGLLVKPTTGLRSQSTRVGIT